MSRPEYKEKEFLMYLYDTYTDKYGKDLSELGNYNFGLIPNQNNPMFKKFPQLCENNTISAPLHWCNKTTTLGYTEYPSSDEGNKLRITLTEKGYSKAYSYKHPIKHFCKENWKWLIPVSFSIILPIIEIVVCH